MQAERELVVMPGDTAEETARGEGRLGRITDAIRQFASFSALLRLSGAILVVTSLSVFLLQGWADGNDIARFYKLLSMSGLLLAGGFGLSYLLSDQKGARMFFGLGMVSVPAIATVLGALLYSLFGTPLASYPDFARWVTPDASGTLLAAVAALTVAAPATLLGTRIMARRSARPISLVFIGLNALLLVPVRDPVLIAILAGVVATVLAWFIPRRFARDETLRTPAGRFALALLFAPLGILVIRNLFLYGADAAIGLVSSVSAFLVLRQFESAIPHRSRLRALTALATVPLSLVAAVSAYHLVPSMDSHWNLIAFSAVLGAALQDRIVRGDGGFVSRAIILLTGIIIAVTALLHAAFDGTAGSVLTGIATAAMLGVMGYGSRNAALVFLGAATAVGSLSTGFDTLLALFFDAGWIGLAVLGFGAIIGASLLERYGALIRLKLAGWRRCKPANDDSERQADH